MSYRDPAYYKCCCCHVHTCTLVISILGIISGALNIIGSLADVQHASIAPSVLSLIAYILLLVANRRRATVFFIPYLIIQVLALIGSAILMIMVIVALAENSDIEIEKHKAIIISALILGVIFEIYTIFVFFVVYKDYKYVRDE